LVLPLAAVACGGAANIPVTPDLSGLIANYDQPDGQLDSTLAGQVIADAPPMPELAAGLRATGLIAGSVNDASTEETPQKGKGVRLQGSIDVTIRCPGDLASPVYDSTTNGTATVTLALENSAIKRTFGGEANGCVLRSQIGQTAVRIVVDGNIAFDLGGDIGIGQRWSGRLLAYLPGELDVAGYVFQSVSARFDNATLEHLVRLANGTYVVLVFTDAGLSIRDKDGSWYCPSGGTTCTRGT
jgi:hypothetical protein